MSQHYFTAPGGEKVQMGYDRPLDYVYCTVSSKEGELIYSNLDDPNAGIWQQDISYYKKPLSKLGITVPENIYRKVEQDQTSRVGNRVVRHDPDKGVADKAEERKSDLLEKIQEALQNRREANKLPNPDAEIDKILSGLIVSTPPKDERKEKIDRMRSALREARSERAHDLSNEREKLAEATFYSGIYGDHIAWKKDLADLLQQESSRGMLARDKIPGSDKVVEVAAIKRREPYQKRPSVRASKQVRKESIIERFRQQQLDRIDVQEMSSYFGVMEHSEITEEGRVQIRQQRQERTAEMLLGDKSFLNSLKTDEGWKVIAALYQKWRAEIRGMPGADILQIRREEQRAMSRSAANDNGRSTDDGRWMPW